MSETPNVSSRQFLEGDKPGSQPAARESRASKPQSKCPGHMRHWFTLRAAMAGGTGTRSPVCTRCGAPNPTPLTTDDWWVFAEMADDRLFALAGVTQEQLLANLEDERHKGYGD